MKLSNIKGERVLDVIAEIVEPIANIADDKVASELFTRKKLPKGMTVKKFMLNRVRKSVPTLLKNHKEDIICILSAIEGVTAEEYKKNLDLIKLIHDFTELITDDAVTTLFFSQEQSQT